MQLTLRNERDLWDYLVHHYHYLGQPRLVGEHLRYLAFLKGQVVACLGWASAAFKVQPRDRFIGWDIATRRKNLCFVANNVRFLILPWVHIPHLASKVLALSLRRLSRDWQTLYAHPLYLAETFVDRSRFRGPVIRPPTGSMWARRRAAANGATATLIMASPKPSTSIPCIGTSGGSFSMTRDEALAILDLDREQAVGDHSSPRRKGREV